MTNLRRFILLYRFIRKRKRRRLYERCLEGDYGSIQSYFTLLEEENIDEDINFKLNTKIDARYKNLENFLKVFERFLNAVNRGDFQLTKMGGVTEKSLMVLDDYLVDRYNNAISLSDSILSLKDGYSILGDLIRDMDEDKKNYVCRHHTALLEETISIVKVFERCIETS